MVSATIVPVLTRERLSDYTVDLSYTKSLFNFKGTMSRSRIYGLLKPNVTSLGYALFLAINAAGVWGGVFPFFPLEFQTTEILLAFFVSQASVFSLTYLLSAFWVYLKPKPITMLMVIPTCIPFFLGWVCLIGAIYLGTYTLPLVMLGGGLLGIGVAGFYMLWQRLFASQDIDTGNRNLIVGTAYAALIYFSLHLIPEAVTAFLIPLVFLPLFGVCLMLKSRDIDFAQPMFEDVPRNHPRTYLRVIKDYWRSAIAVGALGFCGGITRSLAIGNPEVGAYVNMLSMSSSLVAALLLLFLWQFKGVRLNISSAYNLFFPFLITSFFLLPILGEDYLVGFACVIYAFYSCAIILMMIQCAQVSRDRGINPLFIYGFFGGIVFLLHDLGFIMGNFLESDFLMGSDPFFLVAMTSVYLLSLMFFIKQGGFKRSPSRTAKDQKDASLHDHIELLAFNPRSTIKTFSAQASGTTKTTNTTNSTHTTKTAHTPVSSSVQNKPDMGMLKKGKTDEPIYLDRISKLSALVQQNYRLTSRETEVMELIVRGNSVSRIAEILVVSENTIRTHSKRIYSKLSIHKKQDLLDLYNEFNPSELSM